MKFQKQALLFLFSISMTATNLLAQPISYPETPKGTTVDNYFGISVPDPYRWLEDDASEQTAEWVKAQNIVTNDFLQHISVRPKLLKRLREVANYERIGAPFKKGGRWYFFRNDGLQNQSVLYTCDKLGGEARVFLDPNKLSAEGTVALQSINFSNDGKYMAYAISRNGSDWQEFYVIDVESGRQLDDHIVWAKFSRAAWLADGFFYSAYDAPVEGREYSNVNEGQKIYYHRIGTPQTADELFYSNPARPMCFYEVSVNKEETMMFLYENAGGTGNNLYVRDLRRNNPQFMQLTDSMSNAFMPVTTCGDRIIVFTDYLAPRNRLIAIDVNKPARNCWQEVVPEGKHKMSQVEMVGDGMVITYNEDTFDRAYLYGADGKLLRAVDLPGAGSVRFSGEKGEPECFFSFTSFTTPGAVYAYDLSQGTSSLFAEPKVSFRRTDFVTEQVFFQSKDGTRIPMSLTYRKGLRRNGKNPVYLYGYGGFNVELGPSFSPYRIPFLEHGGIYAQVNLRGGGEYGEEWHKAGTKMQKQNVFDDFISAAEWLIAQGYTSPSHIAAEGASNGGLLVGACMTQRPDLFRVCIPRVGVMDMLRYHRFTIGWNWAPDYGTSADSPEMFQYLRAYSPLHTLKPGTAYPATLVTTADHDDRVVPAHSFKFAATLQACQAGNAPTLIRIDTNAGHGGSKPMHKIIEEQADIYSFVMHNLGMKW